ncbi:MAG: hypothetical protein US74_C0003G0003 [Parcubacteria group bacterium GW2011_GWA2_38_13]|nr:MAG: hypothetical protein US74_C0003G0003 [Parcubacteria group bacterium GW2011_GWA2_38_13]
MGIKKILFITLRLIFFLLPIALALRLLYKDFVVSGQLTAEYDFKTPSPFISVLRPQSRVSEISHNDSGDYFQTIHDEPVYFDIRMPRMLDTAKVSIVYKNIDQRIFEAGAMTNKDQWIFDLKPVENNIIDYLFQDKLRWTMIRDQDVVLFQRNKKFQSIKDFLENLPANEKIATYNYAIPKDYVMKNYIARQNGVTINKTLRGTHRMYTYIKNEPIDMEIWIQDVNRHAGDDYASIDIINKDSESIYSNFIKLDNDAQSSLTMSEVREEHIVVDNVPEGLYKIEITSPSDDIFIRRIAANCSYLVFINKVYLGDNVGYSDEFIQERMEPTLLHTNGKNISAITTHVEGLQTLLVNNIVLNIDDTHKEFITQVNFKFKKIIVPRNDITIETKGMISFSDNNFFNPEFATLSDGSEFDMDAISYVIAKYGDGKELDNDWREAKLVFNSSKYYTGDSMLHFVLSLPYIKTGDTGVLISHITVEMSGSPLSSQSIFTLIKNKIKEYIVL